MTRFGKMMVCLVLVLATAAVASAQALGDVARKERTKQKPQAARIYTNEDIPSADLPKEEPKAAESANPADADASAANNKDGEKKDAAAEKTDAEKQAKLNSEWKGKVGDAKASVTSLEREINLMEREERLKVAVYYSDAGNRLRDSKQWSEQERKYQEDLAKRQKDLAAAKEKLDSVQDAARKAGASIE